MIKIFRNIRQRLLTENRISKYLLYAIGEIILVVIGILIALQINNWNNEKQLQKLETEYLMQIRASLQFDLKDIQFNIDFNENKLQSNEVILRFMNKEIDYFDTLQFHFGNLIFTTRTLPNTSAFENLKSRGLEIFSNDSLRHQITKLYSFYYHNAIDFEKQDDHSFQYEIFQPEVSKVINIAEVWKSGKPIDKDKILENVQFKNALTTNILLRKVMLDTYRNVKKKVEECIKQIDEELNK